MDSIDKLTSFFLKFPGIGRRQARRFVFHLLSKDKKYLNELAGEISSIKNKIVECCLCHRFFQKQESNKVLICDICSNKQTDYETLMIVEKDADLDTIVKSGAYSGLYFILGGTMRMENHGKEYAPRNMELKQRIISVENNTPFKEIIIALSATTEGEFTALYIKKMIEQLALKNKLKITLLGRGLSTGTELEYSDVETFKSALKNRQ